jgi:opacity protein-like surface antigen
MFARRRSQQTTLDAKVLAGGLPPRRCRSVSLAGLALAASLFAVSGAQAQNCTSTIIAGVNTTSVAGAATSVAANVASIITAADTAFLTQSSAFVGAPSNPQPDQTGGGIWSRAVGGQVDIKSTSSNSLVLTALPSTTLGTASQPCSTTVRSTFDGVQIGSDLSRLNVNGWNIHLGVTAGSLYTNNSIVGGSPVGAPSGSPVTTQVPFDSSAQIPFIGAYAAVTNGGFFADFLIRGDAYQMTLDSPGQNFFNQNLNARGLSIGGSIGYNYQIPNLGGWFVEPSAGFLYSKVSVDNLNMAGSVFNEPHHFLESGTETFNDITETIGRAGVRVGTSLSYGSLALQPFVSASVWHDFAGNATANWSSTPGLLTCPGPPQCPARATAVQTNAYSGTNIGTYGQYSVGVAGTLANTGWLGFIRADYRNGPNLNGWDATGGLRYQFSPGEIVRTAMPVKAPVRKVPPPELVTWAGLYAGGFGGAELGRANWGYPGGSVDPRVAGILGGFDLGYNWQNGPWVIGLEGDWAWTDAKGGVGCGPVSIVPLTFTVASPLFEMTCNAQQSWVASITPRIGYAWDRALFYLKGGASFTHEQFAATCNFGPLNGVFTIQPPDVFVGQECTHAVANVDTSNLSGLSNGFTASDSRVGWTIGYGVEFALTRNWSARAETDYVDFGSHTLIASDGTPVNVGMHMWQAKLGVNYRFGGEPFLASGF